MDDIAKQQPLGSSVSEVNGAHEVPTTTAPGRVSPVGDEELEIATSKHRSMFQRKTAADVSAQVINTTVRALPITPKHISSVRGPMIDIKKVDDESLDVRITHSFRAHFGSGVGKLECGPSLTNSHNSIAMEDAKIIKAPLGSDAEDMGSVSDQHKVIEIREMDKTVQEVMRGRGSSLVLSGGRQQGLPSWHWSPWEIDPKDIELGRRIAVGGFAEVFVAKYQGTIVAIKRLIDGGIPAVGNFMSEVSILAQLRHPNLVLFMGFCCSTQLCIVSEFMQKGCLSGILKKQPGVPIERKLQRAVAISVARGMAYLHSRDPPILHMDLKSPNILVDNNWRVKITDFGLSQFRYRAAVSQAGSGGGTPHWMAPEVLRCERVNEKADVYSYGVVLWELLTGRQPWEDLHPMQVVGAVGFRGRSLPVPENGDPVLIQLFKVCCQHDPTDRPSFHHILEMLSLCYGGKRKHQRALPPCSVVPDNVPKLWNELGSCKHRRHTADAPEVTEHPHIVDLGSGGPEDCAAVAAQSSDGGNIQQEGTEDAMALSNSQSRGVSDSVIPPALSSPSPFAMMAEIPFDSSPGVDADVGKEGGSMEVDCGQTSQGYLHDSTVSSNQVIPVGNGRMDEGEDAEVHVSSDNVEKKLFTSPFAAYAAVSFDYEDMEATDTSQWESKDGRLATYHPPVGCVWHVPNIVDFPDVENPVLASETKVAPLSSNTNTNVAANSKLSAEGGNATPPELPIARNSTVSSTDSGSQIPLVDQAASCEWKIKVADMEADQGTGFVDEDFLDDIDEASLESPDFKHEHYCSPDFLSHYPAERKPSDLSGGQTGSPPVPSTPPDIVRGEGRVSPPSRRGFIIPPLTFTQDPSKTILSDVFYGKNSSPTPQKPQESLISRFRRMAGQAWRESGANSDEGKGDGGSKDESNKCHKEYQ